jgi:ABC-type nitrate/sulfonate/bicarbonate transport system permease component
MNRFLLPLRRVVSCIVFFAALILLWHVLVQRGTWSSILLPDPSAVWDYLVGAVKDGTLLRASAVTMRRLLIGYGIGIPWASLPPASGSSRTLSASWPSASRPFPASAGFR